MCLTITHLKNFALECQRQMADLPNYDGTTPEYSIEIGFRRAGAQHGECLHTNATYAAWNILYPAICNILSKSLRPSQQKAKLPSFESCHFLLEPPGEGTLVPLQAIPIPSSNNQSNFTHPHYRPNIEPTKQTSKQTPTNMQRSSDNNPEHHLAPTHQQISQNITSTAMAPIPTHLPMDTSKTLPYHLPSALHHPTFVN